MTQNLHRGGKKHPLMNQIKVALVTSRAFGSLGVNLTNTQTSGQLSLEAISSN